MNNWKAIVANLIAACLPQPEEKPRRAYNDSSDTMLSYQVNSGKPCTVKGCRESRFINKKGICPGTRCEKHHRERQAINRAAFKRKVKQ